MRVGRPDGAGTHGCEQSGQDATRQRGQPDVGDPANLECIKEDIDGSGHVYTHVGEPDDQEAADKNPAQVELDTGATAFALDV